MKYTVTTPPAGRPVTWATFKLHHRLDSDTEQATGELYLDAATDYAQDALAASLLTQTITATFNAGDKLALPRGPVVAVSSVTDASGAVTDYDLERVGNSDRVRINQPFTSPVTVVYTAGYGDADDVPATVRAAILAHASTLFENRESVSDRTKTVVPHSLADFYRLKSRNVGIG